MKHVSPGITLANVLSLYIFQKIYIFWLIFFSKGILTHHYKIIRKVNKFDRFVFKFMLITSSCCGAVFFIVSFFENFIPYLILGRDFPYELPFKSEYFYEFRNIFPFILNFVVQAYKCNFTVVINVSKYLYKKSQLQIFFHQSFSFKTGSSGHSFPWLLLKCLC